MELVTQIVILATALVGLYKAATFHRSTPAEPKEEGEKMSYKLPFSDFFDLIGIFLFMLAFPAFIWAFSWITTSTPKAISSSESVEIVQPQFEIGSNPSEEELLLVAASSIPSTHTKNEALEKIVSFALQNKNYKVAVSAAATIPSTHTKNEQLKRIVDAIINNSKEKKKPNNKIQPTAESGG